MTTVVAVGAKPSGENARVFLLKRRCADDVRYWPLADIHSYVAFCKPEVIRI
jgi:hypothetical protein